MRDTQIQFQSLNVYSMAVWNAVFIQIYSCVCLAICNTEIKFKDGMEEVDCNWN